MKLRLQDDDSGASLAEYTMLLALIAVACMTAIGNTGTTVRRKLDVNFAGAVYATTLLPGQAVGQGPGTGAGTATGATDDGSLSGDESAGAKKGKKENHSHPHGGGPGNDNGKKNDDK